ncbi:major facilitator superfamily domain-containing protein [Aspergillus heterothallicus]
MDDILPAGEVVDEVAVTSSSSSPASGSPRSLAEGNPPSEAPAPFALTPPANEISLVQNHSVFTTAQKRFIIIIITLAAFFSPLSAQVYYPVMPILAQNYGLNSMALMNLTITTYMLLQGLAPAILGPYSDVCGRRPAYILSFMIYTAANNGLALQDSYVALMVLRCLQRAGSSGTVSFGYGVIADNATPAQRGSYAGIMTAGVMIAPAFGPVLGGLIANSLGWRIVFLFLALLGGLFLAIYVLFVPETARTIVRDGSVVLKQWWRRPVVQWYVLILITTIGILMFTNIALLTSTSYLFTILYDLSALQIGLCFLPLGIGASLGALLMEKTLDWNYRRYALTVSSPLNRHRTTDLKDFPIERARLQPFFPAILLCIATMISYGFVLQKAPHISVQLVLQLFNGFATVSATNSLNTLLIDLFPNRPATAAAACNLVRCWLGALGAAVVDHMLRNIGIGWCFVIFGVFLGLGGGMDGPNITQGEAGERKELLEQKRRKERRGMRVEGAKDRGRA